MSEINLQFSVNTYSASFTANTNPIVINPVTNNLMMFTGFAAYPPAGGAGNGQVTFNDAGLFSGSNNFTYANTSNTLTVENIVANSMTSSGNVTIGNITSTGNVLVVGDLTTANLTVNTFSNLGNLPNITVGGGSNGQFIKTDGTGNLSFATIPAGGSNMQLQFNSANALGGIPNVTWNGVKLNLGNVANLLLEGGTNGYVLQTDGSGNLTWQAQAGNVTGNGSPGGANTQIQYNRTGVFGGSAGFTYNNSTDTLSVNNANIAGNLIANIFTANSISGNLNSTGNITTTGNLSASNVSGNIIATGLSNSRVVFSNASNKLVDSANLTFNTASNTLTTTTANVTTLNSGNILNTINITSGNVYANSGTVQGSLLTGTLTTGAQPNITSFGTLANLTVSGNIGANNITLTNLADVGNLIVRGNIINNTFVSGNLTTTGNLIIQRAYEKVTLLSGSQTGTVNFDALTQSILNCTTGLGGNITLNLRGNSSTTLNSIFDSSQSITLTFLTYIGTPAYIVNNVQIDGSTATVLWSGAYAPNVGLRFTSATQSYTFTIIKTGSSTYSVLGTFVEFK